jgi:hypothetical protein
MLTAELKFGYNKAIEVAFVKRGQAALHDTCMIVSGPVIRYRLPFINSLFEGLLASPGYRTIPYGAVVRYAPSRFGRWHTVKYRLPSGKEVNLKFKVLGNSEQNKAFTATMNENLTATKALFMR